MKVDTIKGSSYVMTCTKACTVHAVLSSSVDLMLVLEAGKAGQYGFVAPTDAVEISDEDAFVIQIFKTPVPRLFVQDGVQPGEDAILKNMINYSQNQKHGKGRICICVRESGRIGRILWKNWTFTQ